MKLPFNRYWNLLVRYLRPQWISVVWLALLLSASILLQLANPQIMRWFIDAAMAGSETSVLTRLALIFIAIAFVQQALAVGATYLSENVGWIATNGLRSDLAQHCMRLDLSFHKARTPGELIERIDGDITTLANFFTQFAIQLLGNGALLIGIVVALGLEDWRVAAGLIVWVVAGVVLLRRMQQVGVPLWAESRQASAELFGFLEERMAGTEDIRSSGATGYVMRRLFGFMYTLYQRTRRAELVTALLYNAGQSMFIMASATGLGLGAYLYTQGSTTIGGVYLITYYIGLLTTPLERILRQIQDLQKASASIGRIEELAQTRSALVDGPGADFPPGALPVEFDRVSFGYDPDKLVLDELSLTIAPGTVLGVLGRTGSGKTTLIRLLLRLYDPTAGSVRLGGIDLRAATLQQLRSRVGVVTQDVQLFRASVRDNLTFFDRSISDERILAAIEELGLTSWLRSLPHGLDTLLASGGGLSAGQAQLLAFARVLLKDPGVIILDEASSRLDLATERLIEQAIDRLLQGRTGIIIAHRLSTVERADQILILENGHIREHGPRSMLVDDPGSRFSHLLRTGLEEALA
jgi:ATP-binding cassette, subfamily B, bacterial